MSEAGAHGRWWDRARARLWPPGAAPEERAVALATVFCVGLGLWLRARGFFFDVPSFGVDETTWAMMLVELPLRELLIRPPAFMAVSRVIAGIFGPGEMALRALPFCAGVLSLVLAPALARRLYTAPAARLLFVAVAALHPTVVSFGKEFKPYEVSFTLHLLLTYLTLRYVRSGKTRDLGWLLGAALLGGPFAQDLVFAYPGVFLVAGYEAFRHQRRHVGIIALVAALVIGLLVTQYLLIWSQMSARDSAFWGKKYKTFYEESAGPYGQWLFGHYVGVAAFPGLQRTMWDAPWLPDPPGLRRIAEVVWLVLHVVGVGAMIFRRRFRELCLLFLPIGFCLLFNVIGKWPFGVFRANLFLIAYTAAIAAMAFDVPARRFRALAAIVPTTLLVIGPLLVLQTGWGPPKHGLAYNSGFAEAVEWLGEQAQRRRVRKELLLMDRRSCDSYRYYSEFNPRLAHLRGRLAKAFVPECVEKDSTLRAVMQEKLASEEGRFWVLFNLRGLTKQTISEAEHSRKTVARVDIPSWHGLPATPGHAAIAFDRAR